MNDKFPLCGTAIYLVLGMLVRSFGVICFILPGLAIFVREQMNCANLCLFIFKKKSHFLYPVEN